MTEPSAMPGESTLPADPFDERESAGSQGHLSVVETAAQRGIGPLSDYGREIWHGESKPCVSCGELIAIQAGRCDLCGQDHSPAMLEKMRSAGGPWYVMEHIRPFPGVTLERLIRQAKRGVLTQTTVVRGPSTDHQWRFAAETPGLSQYVGCCWECHGEVREDSSICWNCGADLRPVSERSSPSPGTAARKPPRELIALSAAVSHAPTAVRHHVTEDAPRVGPFRAIWIAAALVALFMVIVLMMVNSRT